MEALVAMWTYCCVPAKPERCTLKTDAATQFLPCARDRRSFGLADAAQHSSSSLTKLSEAGGNDQLCWPATLATSAAVTFLRCGDVYPVLGANQNYSGVDIDGREIRRSGLEAITRLTNHHTAMQCPG